jgi:hypothetical protein
MAAFQAIETGKTDSIMILSAVFKLWTHHPTIHIEQFPKHSTTLLVLLWDDFESRSVSVYEYDR